MPFVHFADDITVFSSDRDINNVYANITVFSSDRDINNVHANITVFSSDRDINNVHATVKRELAGFDNWLKANILFWHEKVWDVSCNTVKIESALRRAC